MGLPIPLHSSCSGSKTGAFLLAITAKYVKNFGQFQHLTQETSKSCSFLPPQKKILETLTKMTIKLTVFRLFSFLKERMELVLHTTAYSHQIVWYVYQFISL